MTKGQVAKLLAKLKDCKLPKGSRPADEFAKNVYADPIGKQVVGTLKANGITPDKLRSWGFIAAYISLATLWE